ncbi:MAG TPA: hypothetical protein VFQ12_10415 [Thermoleophilaceae bacterium]|nr:hypothetical protein [Thermoleophilaceae bacterium]
MDAVWIVVIAGAVLLGLAGLGVVAGSGRQRRHEDRRIRADEIRREAEFHDTRAEQARAEAEERMARARREEADPEPGRGPRFVRRSEEEGAAEESEEQLPEPRDER